MTRFKQETTFIECKMLMRQLPWEFVVEEIDTMASQFLMRRTENDTKNTYTTSNPQTTTQHSD